MVSVSSSPVDDAAPPHRAAVDELARAAYKLSAADARLRGRATRDPDALSLTHARALLTSAPEGATDYIDADLRNADQILAKAAETLDFSQPVAVMLMAILQHLGDEHDPYAVVAQLMAALPAGSYLALSHPAKDIHAAEMAEMANRLNQMMAEKVTFRAQAEVAPFFAGLELIDPGMTNVPDWRPETDEEASSPAALWGGVARKP